MKNIFKRSLTKNVYCFKLRKRKLVYKKGHIMYNVINELLIFNLYKCKIIILYVAY